MPKFDEDEGIFIVQEAERHKGNVLTREQAARGGRAGKPSHPAAHVFSPLHGKLMAQARWRRDEYLAERAAKKR